VKDFNLIKWLGANSFRTSHYPYSEELMDQADEQGIVVIDECPAVALNSFDSTLLTLHKQVVNEMIQRDKNRPSVVMWSIANEPHSENNTSKPYFEEVINLVKSLDIVRPTTAAINRPCDIEYLGSLIDVIMINKYFGWYQNLGITATITSDLIDMISHWYQKHKKLLIISEYGAESISGFHQVCLRTIHFKIFVFDRLYFEFN